MTQPGVKPTSLLKTMILEQYFNTLVNQGLLSNFSFAQWLSPLWQQICSFSFLHSR
jgi:hypothetical protein